MQKNINLINYIFKNEEKVVEKILSIKQKLKENKISPFLFHELAINYFLIKNYKKTIETIQELQNKFPDYIDLNRAIKLKIVSHVYLKEYDIALELINNRLSINPQDTFLLSCKAYCYEKMHNISKALEIHRKILDMDPDNVTSLNAYGYLMVISSKDKEELEMGGIYIKQALNKFPDNPYYLDSYAVFLNKKGDKDLAKKFLIQALQKDPENIEIIMHLKEILEIKK